MTRSKMLPGKYIQLSNVILDVWLQVQTRRLALMGTLVKVENTIRNYLGLCFIHGGIVLIDGNIFKFIFWEPGVIISM